MRKFIPLLILACILWAWQPTQASARTDDLRIFGFSQYQIWDFRRLNRKSFDELRDYEIRKLIRYYQTIAVESQIAADVLNDELRYRRSYSTRSYRNRHTRDERRTIRRRY